MKEPAILIRVLLLPFLLLISIHAANGNLQLRRESTGNEVLEPLKRGFVSSDESRPSSLPRSSLRFPEILKGVTFRRTITRFPHEASFVMNMNGHYCQERDEYGDNQCHYEWGQDAAGNYTVQLPDDIEAGDFVTGSLKVCVIGNCKSEESDASCLS